MTLRRSHSRLRPGLPALLLLLSTSAVGAQRPAPAEPPLLRDRPGVVDPIAHLDDSLVFSRPVDVDVDRLARLDPTGGDAVDIQLAPGLAYRMRFDRREVFAEQETVAWIGSLGGLPQSRFVLAICADAVAATFEPHDGVGMILNLMPGPGAHFVRGHRDDANRCDNDAGDPDPAERRALGEGLRRSRPANAGGPQQANAGCCDEDPSRFDVHFVVTPLALTQIGGTSGASAAAAIGITILNNDLISTRSGAGGFTQTARWVGPVSSWFYFEGCNTLAPTLFDLRDDADIAALRNRYQADLVAALIVDNGTSCHSGVAGRAFVPNAPRADTGFSVNRATLAAQVVPHEVGHNLGCQHESGSCSTYNNAWNGICNGRIARTRMWSTLGSSVRGFFSNPDLAPTGCFPLGLANCADNARRIGEFRQGVANYRGGSFASSSLYGSGWPGANGVPTLRAGTDPTPGTNIRLDIANSRGGTATAGVLLMGIQRDSTPTPFGGARLVDPLILESIGIARFQERLNFPSPADPNLCGTTWHSQVVMLDPAASAGLSFTNGLTMNLGR